MMPDAFLMGVSKSATTWIYRCLQECPEAFVPRSDSLRFFDLNYHEGIDKYEEIFAEARLGQICIDPSPTYLRSPVAAERIARHYPDARFVISLRNPIDRAFSQFWHEKKQGRIAYTFDEAINHFLFFPWIVEHGFYATHLQRLLNHFPREQVTVVLYDDLVSDARSFLRAAMDGMGLKREFAPSFIDRRVNEAGSGATPALSLIREVRSIAWLKPIRRQFKAVIGRRNITRAIGNALSDKDEYEAGMSADARRRLTDIFSSEVEDLSSLVGRDLRGWLAANRVK